MAAAAPTVMSELFVAIGLAAAFLCLTGHLPGTVHRWGPQFLALTGMVLMGCGRALPGACLAATACVWSVVQVRGDRRQRSSAIDLAAMTLLMTLMAGDIEGSSHAHMASQAMAPAALIVAVWAIARAGVVMVGQLSDRPSAMDAARSARRARVYQESGSVVMVLAMAAMFT